MQTIAAVVVLATNVGLFRDDVEKMFVTKDKDFDGKLSFEEFMGEKSRAERLFKIMDKDGDGYVTKSVRNLPKISYENEVK